MKKHETLIKEAKAKLAAVKLEIKITKRLLKQANKSTSIKEFKSANGKSLGELEMVKQSGEDTLSVIDYKSPINKKWGKDVK